MDKEIVIMKVGGSCLTAAKSLAQLLRIIEMYKDNTIVFVASAFSGVTDKLIDIARMAKEKNEGYKSKLRELRKEHDDINAKLFEGKTVNLENAGDFITQNFRSLEEILEQIFDYGLEPFRQDYVESFGEKLSTFVMAEYLVSEGMDGVYMPADLLIVTDDRFGNALPIMDFTARKVTRQVVPVLNRGGIPCITGFIGLNKQGFVTTLGRGGTDYTASIIANCLVQSYPGRKVRVIFWKNVDGILSSSPDFVKRPRLLEHLKYSEAKEISHFGAKVLHPKCISPLEIGIPIEIRNFEKALDAKFTRIDDKGDDTIILKGFSMLKDVALVTARSGSLVAVPGVLAKIFTILGESGISVSLVSQSSSEINTTFCTAEAEGKRAVELLRQNFKEWFDFSYDEKVVVLGVIGAVGKPGVKSKIFETLEKINVPVLAIAQSAEALNISVVIPQDLAPLAIQAIHDCFDSCFA